ncbi:hypothetical protein EVAR_76203_1 [Eumeta japonica]|uniref:Uncharacterized protein n=1 Tax=Eumeta variegata TaxID=151549 RepID=A0A4C1UQ53_EUMVA|nr:hypothetical protein EVAR_76203_1 [Eumeta japonica]
MQARRRKLVIPVSSAKANVTIVRLSPPEWGGVAPDPADAPAQPERDRGLGPSWPHPICSERPRAVEVEHGCGMFMALPFYFLALAAKPNTLLQLKAGHITRIPMIVVTRKSFIRGSNIESWPTSGFCPYCRLKFKVCPARRGAASASKTARAPPPLSARCARVGGDCPRLVAARVVTPEGSQAPTAALALRLLWPPAGSFVRFELTMFQCNTNSPPSSVSMSID